MDPAYFFQSYFSIVPQAAVLATLNLSSANDPSFLLLRKVVQSAQNILYSPISLGVNTRNNS